MDSNQGGLDELDEFLSGTGEDTDSQELEDFMSAEEMDDLASIEDLLGLSDEEVEQGLAEELQDLEARSSFAQADIEEDAALDTEIIGVLDSDFEESVENTDASELHRTIPGLDEENELVDIMSGLSGFTEEIPLKEEEEPLEQDNERIEKVTLLQKIKALFRKKELTEEQRLQIEQEEEEERELDEKLTQERELKKQARKSKKQEQKVEAEKKKKDKEEEKARKKEKKAEDIQKKQKAKNDLQKVQKVSIKPMIMIVFIGVSLMCLLILITNINFYRTSLNTAKKYFIHQNYDVAYEELLGLDLNKKDNEFYQQVRIIRMLDIKQESYEQYIKVKQYPEALKSLIGGVEKYEKYKASSVELGVNTEYESIFKSITAELSARFGLDMEGAKAIYALTDKEAYDKKINELARTAAIKDGVVEEVKIQREQN